MRAKSLLLLMLALGCGLVASIGITQVMSKRTDAPAGETETVFVALKNIALNEVLNAQQVKAEEWPKDKVPPGAVNKFEDLEGRRCRTRLYAGEPILKSKLLGKGSNELGVSPQIPKGFRVASVRVDAVSGAASLILPGDRVDVLVHLLANPGAGIKEPVTRTVLQFIKVFAVDNVVSLDNLDGDGKSIQAKTVSLLLTPEQAQKVTMASELGTVRLVLRSPEDDSQTEVPEAMARSLVGGQTEAARTVAAPTSEPAKPAEPGFLDFLKQTMAAKPPGPVDAPAMPEAKPSNRYTMRLLLGSRANEVVLEPDLEMPGQAGEGSFWRATGGNDGPAAASNLLAPPPEPKAVGGKSGQEPKASDPQQGPGETGGKKPGKK